MKEPPNNPLQPAAFLLTSALLLLRGSNQLARPELADNTITPDKGVADAIIFLQSQGDTTKRGIKCSL